MVNHTNPSRIEGIIKWKKTGQVPHKMQRKGRKKKVKPMHATKPSRIHVSSDYFP